MKVMNHSTAASHAAEGRSAIKMMETSARQVFVNVVAALTPKTGGSLSGLPSVSTTATVEITVDRTSAANVARNAAAHPAGPNGSPKETTTWNTSTAIATSRLERAMLKNSLSGGCFQYSPPATSEPRSAALRSSPGVRKNRPSTSGTSIKENETDSRTYWNRTTNKPAKQYRAAIDHHGISTETAGGPNECAPST